MHRLALWILLVGCQAKQESPPRPEPQGSATVEPAKGSDTKVDDKKPAAPLPAIDLAGFAKDCKEATDCVLVKRNACDACACAVDAIASKDMAKFDEAAAKLVCGEPDLDRIMACGGCETRKAACTNGQCVLADAAP